MMEDDLAMMEDDLTMVEDDLAMMEDNLVMMDNYLWVMEDSDCHQIIQTSFYSHLDNFLNLSLTQKSFFRLSLHMVKFYSW